MMMRWTGFDLRWIVSVFSLYYSMIVIRALLWTELRGGGFARHPMQRLVLGYLHRATLDAASLLLAMLIVTYMMSTLGITRTENDDTPSVVSATASERLD